MRKLHRIVFKIGACLLAAVGWTSGSVEAAETLIVRTNYNAMVLWYNPMVLKDGQTRTYWQTYGPRDIDVLCQDYIKFIKRASGGQVNWKVAYRYELKEFPPDNDPEVTFTTENYHQLAMLERYDMWNHGKANYVAICEDPRFSVISRAEAGQLDAIWVFGPNNTGFWETAMAGQGAFWVNGGAYPEVPSSRKIVIYGFGSEPHQGVGFMLENTGHMMEVLMRDHIAVAWPVNHPVSGYTTMDLTNPARIAQSWMLDDWRYFTCTDGVHWDRLLVTPGHSQAGLSHFPPTAAMNYGWSDLHTTFLPWEWGNFLCLDGSWAFELYQLTVTNNGVAVGKAMMQGHRETDARGQYNVPVAFTDVDLEASFLVQQGNGLATAGLTFRCSRYNDGLGRQDGYFLGLQPATGKVQLYRLGPASGHTLLSESSCNLEPSKSQKLFVSVRGSNVTARLDPRSAPVLVWNNLDIDFGAVGLGVLNGVTVFKEVNVTPMVKNYAETWRGYPNFNEVQRLLTSAEWQGDTTGYNDMDYFYAWWYEHLPKNPGIHDVTNSSGALLGRTLNSWWPYMFDINVFSTPYLPHDAVVVCPPADTLPPSTPTGLSGMALSHQEIRMDWPEPADNVGVTRYEVFRDGEFYMRTARQSLNDRYLLPNVAHTYAVKAFDGSGNASSMSAPITIRTLPVGVLFNGDFETAQAGGGGWTNGAYESSAVMTWEPAGPGLYGSRCISITAANPNDAWWIQDVYGLMPSGRYLLTAWIKGENLVIENGGVAGASIGTLGSWDRSTHLLNGTFDWTRVACYLIADGEGHIRVTCRLGHHGSLTTGKAWFDNVALEYAPVPQNPFIAWGTTPGPVFSPPDAIAECLAIAAGDAHAVAVTINGDVRAWGDNSAGQATVPWALDQVAAVAAGGNHSLVVRHDGTVVAWGANSGGQADPPPSATNGVGVAAGGSFSLLLRADGTVVGWGDGSKGQLPMPGDVRNVVQVAAGKNFAAALLSNATLRTWGKYQADSGAETEMYVPPGLSNVTSIACGWNHVAASLADGSVRCWGGNASGQSSVPPGLANVIQVAAGADHTSALLENGTVVSWGNSPVAPVAATNVFAMAAGQGFTLTLANARPPRCWGQVDHFFTENSLLNIYSPLPGYCPAFLLRTLDLQSQDWSAAQGGISRINPLLFRAPINTGQSFFRIKTRPW